MSDVVLREIDAGDIPALGQLIEEAFGEGWNLGRYDRDSGSFQALLETYLSMFLNSGTFGRVAVAGGEVVGAVICSAKGEAEIFRQMQKDRPFHTLMLLNAPQDERADMAEHLSVSFRAIGELLEHREAAYGGSLDFIAVSARSRGQNVGGRLWGAAADYFRGKGVSSVYLIADSGCTTGFYDHNGFARVAQTQASYSYTTG
ncbi:MAG: GNAT family N-acetyltransferase [Defluviitaleaceae bacterium]|nr:GNAT family N-acetyltransferase [Defluviitaleaceae bacterium]